jgi:integrase/recombinase XerD
MLTRGRSVFTPVFSSRLAPVFSRYVDLKRALGQRFYISSRTLQSLDRFLDNRSAKADLNSEAFQAWCQTQEHVSSGVRRIRMQAVYSFCLYRRRTAPQCFVPDPRSFPTSHQPTKPYIFSEAEVAKLLRAASGLKRDFWSPARPEVIRLAIALLFTTGIRCGELLALRIGDYNRGESTLHVRESKYYKSRLLPLNGSIADAIEQCLHARNRRRLPTSADTRLIWNASWGGGAYSGENLAGIFHSLCQKCGIVTLKGTLPRLHDMRHAFAVNALLRWYRAGVNVESKLPWLATYLGHGSVVATHYYLHFIEPLRSAASDRFAKHYGALVSPTLQSGRRCG